MSYISIFLSATQGELNNNGNELMLDFQYFAVITGSQMRNLSTGSEKKIYEMLIQPLALILRLPLQTCLTILFLNWPLSKY